jgi:hypothetical protein
MKLHELKILKEYAEAKAKDLKPFEIRKNDRDFKVGDLVRYIVIDDEELNRYFKHRLYQIVYITDYAQQNDYIVFTDNFFSAVGNLGE